MDENFTKRFHGKARLLRILYPKGKWEKGKWAIFRTQIVEEIEGVAYDEFVVFKGVVSSAEIGQVYEVLGDLEESNTYGPDYRILMWQEDFDINCKEGQFAFLRAIANTPRQVSLLRPLLDLEHPIEEINEMTPEELKKATGLSISETRRISREVKEKFVFRRVYSKLGMVGIDAQTISVLLRKYDENAEVLLNDFEQNPYCLIKKLPGFGWTRIDSIALQMGILPNSQERVRAYIHYYLEDQAFNGHTWSLTSAVANSAPYTLKTPDGLFEDMDALREALRGMIDDGELWTNEEHTHLALKEYRDIEQEIARELHRLASAPLFKMKDDLHAVERLEAQQGWKFTIEQLQAIQDVSQSNVAIITGAAGTGKSTVVSAALKLLPDGTKVAQCALAGKAAARLTEVTGLKGSTIHRLLLGMTDTPITTIDNQEYLGAEVIILDEISMVGAEIFLALLKKTRTGSKLIMIGDDGQLESIGLCNIFKDMLESGAIPVGRLNKIHRQAAKSAIITESMKVRNGEQLVEAGKEVDEVRGELQDLLVHTYKNSNDFLPTRNLILEQYKRLLDLGADPSDIQVIVPMKSRGDACTTILNKDIQELVNARNAYYAIKTGKDSELRLNDRVICVKNNYNAYAPNSEEKTPVYNGDRGIITDISYDSFIVDFDLWGPIEITSDMKSSIELGYALSCHKLQGSEAPYVIIGLDFQSRILLTKEWLYTAITRAKKLCVLIAETNALQYTINTSRILTKRTFLKEFLEEEFGGAN